MDIPHSRQYSNIVSIENKKFYIFFKKPERNSYSKIFIALLDKKRIKKDIKIKATFRKILSNKNSSKMRYKTELIRKSQTDFYGNFRLLYGGLWKLKLKIFYGKEILLFNDYFYYKKI